MAHDAVNPDWTEAIRKAMHNSIVNQENESGNESSSEESEPRIQEVSPRTSTPPPPTFNLNPTPFHFSIPKTLPRHNESTKTDSESDESSQSVSSSSRSSRRSRSTNRSDRLKYRRESQKEDENQEKYELLSRLQHLEQEKGYKAFRALTPEDSIHDIRYEFFRANRDISKRTSVKLMQKYLITFTSFVEMLAQWYNPFDLKLNGYSKSVLLSMKDYEPILEELHYKYSETVSVSPEVKLVLALASSMFFYHTGHHLSCDPPPPPPVPEPRPDVKQGTMRGPRSGPHPTTTMPAAPNPLSMMMPMMMGGGGGGMNIGDLMSGLNMVQTIMKNPNLG